MIRPLAEALYDYRMTYTPETTLGARNSYKAQFYDACCFIAADSLLSSLKQPNASLEDVIDKWNKKNTELNKQKKPIKVDYKTRLDELFRGAGKNYFTQDLERPLSRQRSSEHKESRHSSDRYYSSRRHDSHHKKESHSKYKNSDRY